jgi:hypothetical protein
MKGDPFGSEAEYQNGSEHPLGGNPSVPMFNEQPLDEPPPYESVVMGVASVR